jgi:hypothetical protein
MIVAERGANEIAIFGSTTSTIAAPGAEALTVGQVTPLAPSVTVTNGIGGPTNLLFNDFALLRAERDRQYRCRIRPPADVGIHAQRVFQRNE